MRVLRCTSCDLILHNVSVARGYSACCPGCGSRVAKNTSLSFSGEIALALAALALFFPAQLFPLISIELIGVNLSTTVGSGAVILLSTFPFVGLLVLFCTVFSPFVFLLSILLSNVALHYQHAKSLYYTTYVLKLIRHWVMVDVFLVSLGIAGFKVADIAEISVGRGLFSFVLLQILMAALLSRVSPKRYWDAYSAKAELMNNAKNQPQTTLTLDDEHMIGCKHCGLAQDAAHTHCARCGAKLERRIFQSIQKTWACLIAATIFIFPANFFAISILLTNGKRLEDTIFSGVAHLIKTGMYGIAIIIFTASIIVPVAKIVSLAYILICIHLKVESGRKQRMKMYRFVKWIGKWSVMDLCVIAIMMSLIDRGRLLDFTPGPGAIAFGLVVVLTMIAAESLDSRLIWDKYEQR